MALDFQEQEGIDMPEWDLSGLSAMSKNISGKFGYGEGQWAPGKYAGGLIGGAWDKLKAFQDDEEELEIDNPEDDRTSIAQDLLGMVGGAWDSITDRGATVQDYFADYKRAKPDPARFGRPRGGPSTNELTDYIKDPNYSPTGAPNLMLQAWNRDSGAPAGTLTPVFRSNIWGNR